MTRQTVVCRPDSADSRMFLGDPTLMEGERMYPIVTLSEETFARMGNPETITVTVEVGDTLNPEARVRITGVIKEAFESPLGNRHDDELRERLTAEGIARGNY